MNDRLGVFVRRSHRLRLLADMAPPHVRLSPRRAHKEGPAEHPGCAIDHEHGPMLDASESSYKSRNSRVLPHGPMMTSRPVWALYDVPGRDALIADLQSLRQTAPPITLAVVRSRHALAHLPFLLNVHDLDRRAELLLGALRDAFSHSRLTAEQQVIARWIFFPPEAAAQRFVHERRDAASEEIALTQRDRGGKAVRRTGKQIEDREARMLALVADLLLDSGFADAFAERHSLEIPTRAPADPYEGKGYEWSESEHHLEFDDADPRLQRLRYTITIRAVRRDQRLFWIRHDPVLEGDDLGVEVLSGAEGHSLLARLPDPRPNQRLAHILLFFLGRTLQVGETTRLAFERAFRQRSPDQPWFGMEMDGTPQKRLVLSVRLPAAISCVRWACEEWTGGDAHARLIKRTEHSAELGQAVTARYEPQSLEPWHHYRIVWESSTLSSSQGGAPTRNRRRPRAQGTAGSA